jgi:GYF domain 2
MESEQSGSKDNLREWLYIDTATSTQRGPVTWSLLIKMLEKGAGATSTTLVWKAGMENWLPMAEVRCWFLYDDQCKIEVNCNSSERDQIFCKNYYSCRFSSRLTILRTSLNFRRRSGSTSIQKVIILCIKIADWV